MTASARTVILDAMLRDARKASMSSSDVLSSCCVRVFVSSCISCRAPRGVQDIQHAKLAPLPYTCYSLISHTRVALEGQKPRSVGAKEWGKQRASVTQNNAMNAP